jgi:hypothetical protein
MYCVSFSRQREANPTRRPGYQSDKKKRYPINTEDHARAPWSYINKEDNASTYSSDDLKKVNSRIKRTCKKSGIEIGNSDE